MPVTIVVGRGPRDWVEAADGPSADPSRVWIVGYRDREQSRIDGMLMPEELDPPINCLSTGEVVAAGPAIAAGRVVGDLESATSGVWVHLDLDIVDPGWFFANDAPVSDGIDWDQLTELLTPLCSMPSIAGLSLGCYNPEKDRDSDNGRRIVEVLREALRR